MSQSIESRYNALKVTAERAAADAAGKTYGAHLEARIANRATALAEIDYPRLRSELAAGGHDLPESGCQRFSVNSNGYRTPYGALTGQYIIAHRSPCTGEPNYAQLARLDLQVELDLDAKAAHEAFEHYRQAVVLGKLAEDE